MHLGCFCPGSGGYKTNLDINWGFFEQELFPSSAAWKIILLVFAQQRVNPALCCAEPQVWRSQQAQKPQATPVLCCRPQQEQNKTTTGLQLLQKTFILQLNRRELLHWTVDLPAPAHW